MRPQSGIIVGIEHAEWTLKLIKHLIGSRRYTESYYFEIELEIKTKIPLKCEVSFEIASENEFVIQQFHDTVHGSKSIGTLEFLKRDDVINKFANDDKLFLRLKAQFSYISKEDQSIHGTTKFIQNNEWSKRLQNHGEKNFKFIVGDEFIEIHKFFLTLESSVFAAMFENNDFKETQTGEMVIKDFKFEIVKAVVDFCYGKDISKILKFAENAVELLMFADKYNMKNLKNITVRN
uniref:BTB domain-containing protein n=1 Tax=Panagrolaimus davidi TaxID=227884 RepID=A0A914PJ71_9BILA